MTGGDDAQNARRGKAGFGLKKLRLSCATRWYIQPGDIARHWII
jgi:hypothetical protein